MTQIQLAITGMTILACLGALVFAAIIWGACIAAAEADSANETAAMLRMEDDR